MYAEAVRDITPLSSDKELLGDLRVLVRHELNVGIEPTMPILPKYAANLCEAVNHRTSLIDATAHTSQTRVRTPNC